MNQQQETCGISVEYPKTTALFCDRVYSPDTETPPCALPSPKRRKTATPGSITFFTPLYSFGGRMTLRNGFTFPDEPTLRTSVHYLRGETLAYVANHGYKPILYTSPCEVSQTRYQRGDRQVVGAALQGLGIVDEEALTWEQVLEIREDARAVLNLKQVFLWLDNNMVDKDPSYIVDTIGEKIDRYEQALKKWGILTKAGSLAALVPAAFEVVLPDMFSNAAVISSTLSAGLVCLTGRVNRNASRDVLEHGLAFFPDLRQALGAAK